MDEPGWVRFPVTAPPVLDRPTVAVIGGGFSGLLTTLHLLHDPAGPRVRLIERRPNFARGVAYSTTEHDHLLNVRASNMSAFPHDPDHFVRWLNAGANTVDAKGFVSRALYGRYLQELLRDATDRTAAGRLVLEADGARRVQPEGAGWAVQMDMGRSFAADAVVLAVGNLAPAKPPGFSDAALASTAYHADPWSADLSRLPEAGLVLLLGTGLTMVDAALRISRMRPALRMLALSRRGLTPRRHLGAGPAPATLSVPAGAGVQAVTRELRLRAQDVDWRAVVDGFRPHVQGVWRDWTAADRNRFLRHVRPWWDVHRHRLSPEVASKLDHLTGCGLLSTAAGRLSQVEPAEGDGLEVDWTPRGGKEARRLSVQAVVNCTGPAGDLARTTEPLLRDAARDGLIRPDACSLGLDVDAEGRLIDVHGRPSPTLFGVGPLTRGAFWEVTSVPDIRLQAKSCANLLLQICLKQRDRTIAVTLVAEPRRLRAIADG